MSVRPPRASATSRFPSAFGHTPSYRSYLRGGALTGAFPYDTHMGPVTNPPAASFSAYWPGYHYDLAAPALVNRLGYLDLADSSFSSSCGGRKYTSYACR